MRLRLRTIYNTDFTDILDNRSLASVLRLVLDGMLVGLVAGLCASSFRWFLHYLSQQRDTIMMHHEWYYVVAWFTALALMGYLVHRLLQWEPLSGGSGIPQIEGEMMGLFSMKAGRMLLAKYLGGALTSLGGFSVGREGPSIQVGGAAGKLVSQCLKRSHREERVLISAGSAAGLTCAFSAPISGSLFVFEEVHKSFYPILLIPTFLSALVANYIASLLFGINPTLGFTITTAIPIQYFAHLVALGIFIGLIGVIFNKTLIAFKKWYRQLPIPASLQMMLTFMTVGAIGYGSLDLLGGGNTLVSKISGGDGSHALLFLLFILIGKILLTCLCYGSGAPGGIFFPLLVIGAAGGSLFYNFFLEFGLVPVGFLGNFVLASLAGIMASSIRVPLLSMLLVLEMTQSFENTYPIGVVTVTAYLVGELLHNPPIYDSLLTLMTPPVINEKDEQTLFEIRISTISHYIGLSLKDIMEKAPTSSTVIGIGRRGHHIVPNPNIILEAQDVLYISCAKGDLELSKQYYNKDNHTSNHP